MPTQLKPGDVEKAIIAALKANGAISASGAQVQGLSSKNWDEQGNIIVLPPAVLVLLEVGTDQEANDTTRLTYESEYEFSLFCGSADLSSVDNERNSAYALLANVRAAMAGQRLQIDAGAALTFPVKLAGFRPEQFDANGAWCSQQIRVGQLAQYG
ncbi:MAG TPA: hypothetical protein VI636_09380 [Candidatus Angelobacter sp.]